MENVPTLVAIMKLYKQGISKYQRTNCLQDLEQILMSLATCDLSLKPARLSPTRVGYHING